MRSVWKVCFSRECLPFRQLSFIIVLAVICYFASTPSHAQVIVTQNPGTDFLAFEAEDIDSFTNGDDATGFAIVSTTEPFDTAFGSTVLHADTNATGFGGVPRAVYDQPDGNDQDTSNYKLQFAEPGTYYLYLHYTMFEDQDPSGYGNEDSYFVPRDFGISAAGPRGDNNWWISTPSMGSTPEPNGGGMEGEFHWWRTVENDGLEVSYEPTVGEVLDWNFAARERGTTANKWVFSQVPDLTPEQLDELEPWLPVQPPEPRGDFNEDGAVDAADFEILAANTNTRVETGLAGYAKGDYNLDSSVNLRDFLAFREAFEQFKAGGVAAAVPEPAGLTLAGFGLAAAAYLRRRRKT